MITGKIKLVFILFILGGINFSSMGQSIAVENSFSTSSTASEDIANSSDYQRSNNITYLYSSNDEKPSIPVKAKKNIGNNKKNTVYCSSSASNNKLEWITGVVIGPFSNISNGTAYSDFSDLEIRLFPGTESEVVLTPGYSGSSEKEFWRIWIDFNNDGNFDEVNELVYKADNIKNSHRGIISIPSFASGKARMRISMKKNDPPSPCKSFDNGEVEDYTVDFGNDNKKSISQDKLYLELFPNPAKNIINIRLDSNHKYVNLTIYNERGAVVKTIKTKSPEYKLYLYDFEKGTYYMEANNGTLNISKQFVVK
ncbi:MAG TPA: T9SS type A sorting domain-containing protein [Bacteroidetes bacterium]|nr:T9SS type A sorting domain-containing protein [Bacteroidota bacterium]